MSSLNPIHRWQLQRKAYCRLASYWGTTTSSNWMHWIINWCIYLTQKDSVLSISHFMFTALNSREAFSVAKSGSRGFVQLKEQFLWRFNSLKIFKELVYDNIHFLTCKLQVKVWFLTSKCRHRSRARSWPWGGAGCRRRWRRRAGWTSHSARSPARGSWRRQL